MPKVVPERKRSVQARGQDLLHFNLDLGENNCSIKYLNTHRVAAYWHKAESESIAHDVYNTIYEVSQYIIA